MQETTQLLQMFVSKGKSACQLLSGSLGMCCPLSLARVMDCSGFHCCLEDKSIAVTADMTRPSPTYIINIHNSTLTNCVLGNGNYQSVSAEQQPLVQNSETETNEPVGSSCTTTTDQPMAAPTTLPAPAANIEIHSSQLRYVIIGDHNSMLVDTAAEGPAEGEIELEEA